LNITIKDDTHLEDNEVFRIEAAPPAVPDGYERCHADIVILDDDGK